MTWPTSAVWCKFDKRKKKGACLLKWSVAVLLDTRFSPLISYCEMFEIFQVSLGDKEPTAALFVSSGIVPTRRRTSRTTRTGSKRRSTCCCAARLSSRQSEAPDWLEELGRRAIAVFLISNVCSNCFTLFKFCFKTFFSCHVGEGCVLYVNVWLLIIKFFFHSKFICSASFPP